MVSHEFPSHSSLIGTNSCLKLGNWQYRNDEEWEKSILKLTNNIAENIFLKMKESLKDSLDKGNQFTQNQPYTREWKFSFVNLPELKNNLEGCLTSENILCRWVNEIENSRLEMPIAKRKYFERKMVQLCEKIGEVLDSKFTETRKGEYNHKLTFTRTAVEITPEIAVAAWIDKLAYISFNEKGDWRLRSPVNTPQFIWDKYNNKPVLSRKESGYTRKKYMEIPSFLK